MRNIVIETDDIFVSVRFVNLSKICRAWIAELRRVNK